MIGKYILLMLVMKKALLSILQTLKVYKEDIMKKSMLGYLIAYMKLSKIQRKMWKVQVRLYNVLSTTQYILIMEKTH
jgi:hypothetical protein